MSRKPQQGKGSGHQGIPSFSPASSGPLSSYESPRGYTHSLGDMLHTETGMRGPSLSTFAKVWGAGYSSPALERPLFTAMAPHSTWKLTPVQGSTLIFKHRFSVCTHVFLALHLLPTSSQSHPLGAQTTVPIASAIHRNSCPAHVCSVAAAQSLGRNCQCGQWPGPKGSQGTSLTRGQQRDNRDRVSRS